METTKKRRLSLKIIKRRLSWTRSSSTKCASNIDGHLTELTDNLTIEENGVGANGLLGVANRGVDGNGESCINAVETVMNGRNGHTESQMTSLSEIKMRLKTNRANKDLTKRLSLPANVRSSPTKSNPFDVSPLSEGSFCNRRLRRESLSEIGFGKMESYTKLDKLGEGTYATVFKGKSQLTDSLVALKEIRLEFEEGAPCTAIREVSLLRNLKHANIVTLHDIIHTDKMLTIVFEYLEKDLKQYLDDCNGFIHMGNVRLFLFQILRGLAYCHKRRILHRDLKPQNLLVSHSGEVKLADFGLARAKSIPTKTYSNEVVTLWYRPPDILLGSTEYSTPIDIWGVGCILFEMASGRPLFPGSTVEDQLKLIFVLLGTPVEATWPTISEHEQFRSLKSVVHKGEQLNQYAPRLDQDGHNLLHQFLLYDVSKRISAADAMKHALFNDFGQAVHLLPDTESVFAVPSIFLNKELGLFNLSKRCKIYVTPCRTSWAISWEEHSFPANETSMLMSKTDTFDNVSETIYETKTFQKQVSRPSPYLEIRD